MTGILDCSPLPFLETCGSPRSPSPDLFVKPFNMNMLALAAHHKHRRCQHPSPDAAISSASDFKMLVSADEDKGTRKPSLRSKIVKVSPPTLANLRKSLTSSFTKMMGKKNDLFDF